MPVLIEDDGMIPVVIGDVEIAVDVYEVYNRLVDIQAAAEAEDAPADKPTANAQIVALLVTLGFPQVSQRAAVKFAEAIFAHMGELRKKDTSAPSASTSAD